MILLREDKESPAALSWGHGFLETNYFRPEMQNTLELRLMTEPDPVRVVDARSKRLMTERDIVALPNIRHFARSDGAPQHKELTRGQIDELASLLNRGVAGNNGTLPPFFADAVSASRRWAVDMAALIRDGAPTIAEPDRLQTAMDSMF